MRHGMKMWMSIGLFLGIEGAADATAQRNFGIISLIGTRADASWDWSLKVDLDALGGDPSPPGAKAIYEGLNISPRCDSQFCRKGLRLSTGEELWSLYRFDVDFYGLTFTRDGMTSQVRVPFTTTISDPSDQATLKNALGTSGAIAAVDGRFSMACDASSCSYNVSSISLYRTQKHVVGQDRSGRPIYEEIFQRGDPYSLGTVWDDILFTVNGPEADALATAIGVPVTQDPVSEKTIELLSGASGYARFSCLRYARPESVECQFSLRPTPGVSAPFAFPETLSFRYEIPLSTPTFPSGFNYQSREGMMTIACHEDSANQTCQLQFDPLGGEP